MASQVYMQQPQANVMQYAVPLQHYQKTQGITTILVVIILLLIIIIVYPILKTKMSSVTKDDSSKTEESQISEMGAKVCGGLANTKPLHQKQCLNAVSKCVPVIQNVTTAVETNNPLHVLHALGSNDMQICANAITGINPTFTAKLLNSKNACMPANGAMLLKDSANVKSLNTILGVATPLSQYSLKVASQLPTCQPNSRFYQDLMALNQGPGRDDQGPGRDRDELHHTPMRS